MSSRIYSITSVNLTLIKTKPPSLQVTAAGQAASSGWSNPNLAPFVYIQPPPDGIQDYDFVATPPKPGDIVLPVLTPIQAETVIPEIDIDNYWGRGKPLVGVRCHAVANNKTALLAEDRAGMPGMRVLGKKGRVSKAKLSFETDIKPLFRPQDVAVMQAVRGFNLHDYDDVVREADNILDRLKEDDLNLLMPCDGAWPKTDIDLFEAWIDAGKPA